MTEEERPRKKRVKKVVKKKRVVKKVRRRPEGEAASAAPGSSAPSSSAAPSPRKKVKKKVRRAPAAAAPVKKSRPREDDLDDLQDEEATPQLDSPVAEAEEEAMPARSSSRRSSSEGGSRASSRGGSSRKKKGRGKGKAAAVEPDEDAVMEPMIRNALILVIVGLFIPLLGTAGSFLAVMGKKRVELSNGTKKGANLAMPIAISGVVTCILSTLIAFAVFSIVTMGMRGFMDMIGMGKAYTPAQLRTQLGVQAENGNKIMEAMIAWANANEDENGMRRFPKHAGILVQEGTLPIELFKNNMDPYAENPPLETADPGKDWYKFGGWIFLYEPLPGEPIFEVDRIYAISIRENAGQAQPMALYGDGANYQDWPYFYSLIVQENRWRYERGLPLIDLEAMDAIPVTQINKFRLYEKQHFDKSKLTVRKQPDPSPVRPDPQPENTDPEPIPGVNDVSPEPEPETEEEDKTPDIGGTPQPDTSNPFGETTAPEGLPPLPID